MKSQFSMLVASGTIATFLGTLGFYLWTNDTNGPGEDPPLEKQQERSRELDISHSVFEVPLRLESIPSYFSVDKIYTKMVEYPFTDGLETDYHFEEGEKVNVLFVELTAKRTLFSYVSENNSVLRCLGAKEELLAGVHPVFLVRAPLPDYISSSPINWNGGEKGLLIVALPRIAKRSRAISVEFERNVFRIE